MEKGSVEQHLDRVSQSTLHYHYRSEDVISYNFRHYIHNIDSLYIDYNIIVSNYIPMYPYILPFRLFVTCLSEGSWSPTCFDGGGMA